jgi:hypothetical protein
MNCRTEILSMRTRRLLACIAFALAASTSAQSADLDVQASGGGFSRYAVRAEQLVIYDFEPGTLTRAYWLAPWRNRHYFPMTGKRPRLGRDEDLTARADVEPAEDYYREWSTLRLMPRLIRGSELKAPAKAARAMPSEDIEAAPAEATQSTPDVAVPPVATQSPPTVAVQATPAMTPALAQPAPALSTTPSPQATIKPAPVIAVRPPAVDVAPAQPDTRSAPAIDAKAVPAAPVAAPPAIETQPSSSDEAETAHAEAMQPEVDEEQTPLLERSSDPNGFCSIPEPVKP